MKETNHQTKSAFQVILAWRWLIYRFIAAAAILSIVISLLLPRWYPARCTFLPPQESGSQGSILQLFSQIGMEMGGGGLFSDTPMSDMMLGILKSRRLHIQLVDNFDLVGVYGVETAEHAIRDLEELLQVNTTPEGLIEVRIEDRDKQRAADMANALVDYLDTYNRETSIEQAKRTTEYIRGCLDESNSILDTAADRLRAFQLENGTIELVEQTRATIEAAAELQAEQTRLEIQRGILKNFTNPNQVQRIEIETRLAEVEKQMMGITSGVDTAIVGNPGSESHGVFLPLARIPSLSIEVAKLTRDVLVQEKVFEYLTAQYEQSRIQEAKDMRTLQIVDNAVPPLKKSRPRRSLIVILTTTLATIAGVGLAFACDGVLESERGNSGTVSASISPEVRTIYRISRWLARWSGAR